MRNEALKRGFERLAARSAAEGLGARAVVAL
jgi:hypothetical protein